MSTSLVLVVDDNELNRELLREELEDQGYEVEDAVDGPDALAAVARRLPDLILLDIQMPGMSGVEVLRELRAEHAATELPIIMVTAVTGSDEMVEALNLGATDYVTKPIDAPVLLARIAAHLRVKTVGAPSGAFQRLTGAEAAKSSVSRFCEHCESALRDDVDACPHCHEPQPADGWHPVPRDEPLLGRSFGGYFFETRLGAGWEGTVYRVLSVDVGRRFAAKVVDLEREIAGYSARDAIVSEVQALAKLKSPHVLQLFQVVNIGNDAFAIITEYIEGMTLTELLGARPLRPRLALKIVRQVALGLHDVHAHAMVHCDLKPDNVMVQQLPGSDVFARVVDFGIVRGSGSAALGDGVFVGTPRWAPPERFLADSQVDARSDIYSLGALMFTALTGRPPYEETAIPEVLRNHFSTPTPRLSDTGWQHQDFVLFDAIIAKAMAKKPEDRYQSMAALAEAIETVERVTSALDDKPTGAPVDDLRFLDDPTLVDEQPDPNGD